MFEQAIGKIVSYLREKERYVSDTFLRTVLTESFIASLEKDEGRPVKFRIFLKHAQFYKTVGASPDSDFSFYPIKLPFSSNELVKLSQALGFSRSGIVVAEREEKPTIIGLLSLGAKWEQFLLFEDSSASHPSSALTISFNNPGSFTVHFGFEQILSFKKCRIAESTARSDFDRFPNPGILANFIKVVGTEVPFENELDLKNTFSKFLGSLVLRAMKKGHGGTIVFGEKTQQLRDHVRIKYDFFFKNPQVCTRQLFLGLKQNPGNKEVERWVVDYSDFLAGLTNVDGALVLDYGFGLIGFGAEIRTKTAQDFVEHPIFLSHGTRHRSAYCFSNEFDPGLAIVMSQDGGNKVFFKENNEVVIIENFEGLRREFLY